MSWMRRVKGLFRAKMDQGHSGAGNEPAKLPTGCVLGFGCDKCPGDAGYLVTHECTGLQLIWVPGTKSVSGRSIRGGCFLMGSTPQEIAKQWKDNGWTWEVLDYLEQPQHPVELSPFWLSKTEVTNASFERFVTESHYNVEGKWSEYGLQRYPDHPVVGVTWNDAQAFCNWANLELPTEAQWEWAARGPAGNVYPWGDDWNRVWCNNHELHAGPLPTPEAFDNYIHELNVTAKSGLQGRALDVADAVKWLRPVGSFPKDMSWCGAMDMAGNVQEWCSDYFEGHYYRTSPKPNPTGPNTGFDRAWRGGSYRKVAYFCRSASRGMSFAEDSSSARGFRPCLRAE